MKKESQPPKKEEKTTKAPKETKSKKDAGKKDKPELQYQNFGVGYSIYRTTVSRKFLLRKPYQPDDPNKITAFIPGTILDVKVEAGQEVKMGTLLLVLEAMKMKNRITAPFDAIIKSVNVAKGDNVKKNQLLIELEAKL